MIVAPPSIETVAKRLTLLRESVPQTYVFDKSGKRVYSFAGELVEDSDKAAFVKAIEDASGR